MKFFLNGDLNQMFIQKKYLESECVGFKLKLESGLHPYLNSKEEYERAVSSFWLDKVEGWWNYRTDLIKNELCTEDQLYEVLRSRIK